MANKLMNLKRGYTHSGRDFGPGPTQVPEEIKIGNDIYTPYADLVKREDEYDQHLKAGGEPVAPVTPSMAGNLSGRPENFRALNTPNVSPMAESAKQAAPKPAQP